LEALLVSTISVALAEIGDKTQLLALVLAARFRKPWPIIWGILVATLINHALAAELGAWLSTTITPDVLRWTVALSFIAMAAWVLAPDRLDDKPAAYSYGAFLSTLIAFFLVEIGDKTQVATALLAAKYSAIGWVVMGTTLGMLAANVPVVFAGRYAAEKLPLRLIRRVAAALFILIGVAVAAAGAIPWN
jgi:Ca2+/H+ antiporter, TMEM165/GDT1 family